MKSKLFSWLSVVMTLVACTGAPKKLYEGEERARSEIAILRDSTKAKVMAIDGVKTSGTAWALLAGTYEIALRVRGYMLAPGVNVTYITYCWLSLNAEAGGEYQSQVQVEREIASDMREKVTLKIGVFDGEEALVAQTYRCVTDRPSF